MPPELREHSRTGSLTLSAGICSGDSSDWVLQANSRQPFNAQLFLTLPSQAWVSWLQVQGTGSGPQGPWPWVTQGTWREVWAWPQDPWRLRSNSGAQQGGKSGTGARGRKIETQWLEEGPEAGG